MIEDIFSVTNTFTFSSILQLLYKTIQYTHFVMRYKNNYNSKKCLISHIESLNAHEMLAFIAFDARQLFFSSLFQSGNRR